MDTSIQVMFRMLDHYHEVVGSVEGAELELLLEDLKATEVWDETFPKELTIKCWQVALQPGFIRLTWNSLGISDYITQSDICICRTESVIRQIHTIRSDL